MIASSTPPSLYTERFTWRTDAGEAMYRLDKCLSVAEIVMARRQTEYFAAPWKNQTPTHRWHH